MRNDIVKQAQDIKYKTDNHIANLVSIGAAQLKELSKDLNRIPDARSGIFAEVMGEWNPNVAYKKNQLFKYNGNMGFIKQDHTSLVQYVPFSKGTEALYGARPNPDWYGVYPYVYNMAASVGMRVRDESGKIFECYQDIPDMLFPPDQLPAHFKLIDSSTL